MKKALMILTLILVMIFGNTFASVPSTCPYSSLHIKDYLIISNCIYVSFQEEVCSRVYDDWQMQIKNLSDPQTKAFLALIINAKNNQSPVTVWWINGNSNPTTISDLTEICGICEK